MREPDPGKRIAIADYDVNDQNRIRRGYIAKGACRPKKYAFPQHPAGGMRRFVAKWFKSYKWLEYSKELDGALCLYVIFSMIICMLVEIICEWVT